MQDAVLDLVEDVQAAPGAIVTLGQLEKASAQYVDIEATMKTLWEPLSPKIQQVGLLEDDTGTTKFTCWMKSGAKLVREGERVRIRDAARNWYRGRCSVALIRRTTV